MSSLYSRIDLGATGEIRGQMFDADHPKAVRVLEVLLDGQVCAETVCDLAGVAVGETGATQNGFEIVLPLGQMRFAPNARLTFRDKSSATQLDRPRPVPQTWRARQLADPTITGYVETVTDEGRVVGWAWAPAAPRERLTITVMLDDKPALTTIASFDRADLREAGIGDGKYGFDCVIPWDLFAHQRRTSVSLRATPMLIPFGKAFVLRREQGGKLEERLAAAEAELKRVTAECTRLQTQVTQAGLSASVSLFETVGAFFQELAAGAARGEVPILAARRGPSLADLSARHPKLTFAAPPIPAAARVIIPAIGAIESVIGCLESIQRTGADRRAEVLLFDPGTTEEAALLPAMVRNLRYLRVQPGEDPTRLRNEALLGGAAPVIILLAPPARVEGAWLDLLLAALRSESAPVAAGAGLLRPDGLFHSTGLLLGGGAGRMIDIGAGRLPAQGTARARRACDAIGFGCVAISAQALAAQNGFDPTLQDWPAALLNFCLAARSQNAALVTEPAARAHWLDLPDQPVWIRRNLGSATPPMPQLRLRWKNLIQTADAENRGLDRLYQGHILAAGENPRLPFLATLNHRISLLSNTPSGEPARLQGIETITDLTDITASLIWATNPEKLAQARDRLPENRLWLGPDWHGETALRPGDIIWVNNESERRAAARQNGKEGAAIKVISEEAIREALDKKREEAFANKKAKKG